MFFCLNLYQLIYFSILLSLNLFYFPSLCLNSPSPCLHPSSLPIFSLFLHLFPFLSLTTPLSFSLFISTSLSFFASPLSFPFSSLITPACVESLVVKSLATKYKFLLTCSAWWRGWTWEVQPHTLDPSRWDGGPLHLQGTPPQRVQCLRRVDWWLSVQRHFWGEKSFFVELKKHLTTNTR